MVLRHEMLKDIVNPEISGWIGQCCSYWNNWWFQLALVVRAKGLSAYVKYRYFQYMYIVLCYKDCEGIFDKNMLGDMTPHN